MSPLTFLTTLKKFWSKLLCLTSNMQAELQVCMHACVNRCTCVCVYVYGTCMYLSVVNAMVVFMPFHRYLQAKSSCPIASRRSSHWRPPRLCHYRNTSSTYASLHQKKFDCFYDDGILITTPYCCCRLQLSTPANLRLLLAYKMFLLNLQVPSRATCSSSSSSSS